LSFPPSEWRWSSYLATCAETKAPEWLTTDWILATFSAFRAQGIRNYKQFVDEGKNKNPWSELKNQLYFGSDTFVAKTMNRIAYEQDFVDIPKPQYTQPAVVLSLAEYKHASINRNEAILLAFKSGAYALTEIGGYFGLHYSSISKIINGNKAVSKA